MHEPISTLRDLLKTRRLTMAEVLAWSAGIAGELAALHDQGCRHGAVEAGNVWIAGMSTRLTPAPASGAAGELQDIVQFAALLREMLEGVELAGEGERVQWGAIDRIAATNLRATEGSRMKKVAWALKLLRSTRPITAPARFEVPPEEPAPERPRPHQRFLMLLREVPPPPESNPKRFYAKTIHVWGFVACAAVVVGIGCAILLKMS